MDHLIGKKIWLDYFDQNFKFEKAFTPQYCTINGRYSAVNGTDDWYLIALDLPVTYEGTSYEHLLIRSRWEGRRIGEPDNTSVCIVLVPDAALLADPFECDLSQYIAWGLAADKKEDIMSPTATNNIA